MGTLADRSLARQDLKNNTRNRVCYCFCLDTSLSMGLRNQLKLVNDGVRLFIENCKNDVYARGSAEVCIVTFGGGARVHQRFANVRDIVYEDFDADGTSPLGAGVELALKEIQERQQEFADSGISSFKPWLIIMSDGHSSDDISRVVELVKTEQQKHRLKVICKNLGSDDKKSDLAKFTLDGVVDEMANMEFEDFFDILSKSAMEVSSQMPSDID